MTGKFPIANWIKANREFDVLYPQGHDMINPDMLYARLISDQTAFFDVQVASELYWTSKKDYYTLDSDFGPMRPPFDVMWMEWSVPRRLTIKGKEYDRERPLPCAAAVTSSVVGPEAFKTGDFTGTRLIGNEGGGIVAVEVMNFLFDPDIERPVFIPYAQMIGLDPGTGLFNDYCVGQTPVTPLSEEERKMVKELADNNVIWMALNLINCRNVDTKATGVVFPRSGREKRQGRPITRYHTIVLPGMSSRSHVKHSSADRIQMAHHRVRGHFKTFTAERPLLGKHVGTYWWGWQARGSKEHGEIKADYTLGETG